VLCRFFSVLLVVLEVWLYIVVSTVILVIGCLTRRCSVIGVYRLLLVVVVVRVRLFDIVVRIFGLIWLRLVCISMCLLVVVIFDCSLVGRLCSLVFVVIWFVVLSLVCYSPRSRLLVLMCWLI